jgi:hypothetical protein
VGPALADDLLVHLALAGCLFEQGERRSENGRDGVLGDQAADVLGGESIERKFAGVRQLTRSRRRRRESNNPAVRLP